jgi:hypothetical protein
MMQSCVMFLIVTISVGEVHLLKLCYAKMLMLYLGDSKKCTFSAFYALLLKILI